MKKKLIRCVEAKTLKKLKDIRKDCPSKLKGSGSSYVYYGFANSTDDSAEHIQALKNAVEKECRRIGWGAPTTIPMTVCKIKTQQSATHAHMTMVKVLVPNNEIVGYFAKRHIEL